MTIALQNLIVRSKRRVRLVFSEAVASGAFVADFYSVTSLDSFGADPTVNGVLVVPDSPQDVELSFSIDLAPSGGYQLSVAAGVPALAGGTSAAANYRFAAPAPLTPPSPEVGVTDVFSDLYGDDIAFAEDDFVETAEGDLATNGGGPQNVVAALTDRGLAEGLPWDDTYGAKPREFVDGSDTELTTLRVRTIAQFLLDDRVSQASATSSSDPSGESDINVSVTLVGQSVPTTVTVPGS